MFNTAATHIVLVTNTKQQLPQILCYVIAEYLSSSLIHIK